MRQSPAAILVCVILSKNFRSVTQGQPLKSGCKSTAFQPNRQTFIQEISKNNRILTTVHNQTAENYGAHIILLYGNDATVTHQQGMGHRRENGAEGGKNAHAAQKAAFRITKGRVSHGKRQPFATRKTASCNTLEYNRLRTSYGIRLYKVIAYGWRISVNLRKDSSAYHPQHSINVFIDGRTTIINYGFETTVEAVGIYFSLYNVNSNHHSHRLIQCQ